MSMVPVIIEAIQELEELWKLGQINYENKRKLKLELLSNLTAAFAKIESRINDVDKRLSNFKLKSALLNSRLDEMQFR